MSPGDVFNPWFGACGFYPADIVGRQTGKILTHGQKRLYDRLVRYAGRDGRCFPSQERLAADLGISERQIRKNLIRLEAFRLIDRQAREGRRGDTYTFLWHPMFDVFERNCGSGQTGGNEDLSGTPGLFDRNCGSAYLIKEQKKSSSSSPSTSGSRPGDDDELFSSEGKTQTHSPEDRQRFGKFMREMIEPSPPDDPRDDLVAQTLTRAPGWSVDEVIEAIKINSTESQSTPKFYRWFLKVLGDIFAKRGGVAPKIVRIEKCPHGQRIWRAHSRKYSDCWTCQNAFDEAAQRPGIACVRCMDTGSQPHSENLYTLCYCEAGRHRAAEKRAAQGLKHYRHGSRISTGGAKDL